VAAWCAENDDKRFVYCLSGPAVRLFGEILGEMENHSASELESLVSSVDMIVCGTSEKSAVMDRAIQLASENNVPSVAYLDHWFGFRRRFVDVNGDANSLPDEIWVTDDYAASRALLEGLPESKIMLKGSPYVERLARTVRELGASVAHNEKSLLFISEPIISIPALTGGPLEHVGFNEFELLEDVIQAAGDADVDKIVVRLHPSEPVDQYDAVLRRLSTSVEVTISEQSDLAVDLARSIAAVGSNSTALVTAAAAGLRTISYIPEGGRPCVLPHDDIAKIQNRSVLADELAKLGQS